MLTEREAEKLVLLTAMPFLFGAIWFAAVARFTLELGEIPICPTKPS